MKSVNDIIEYIDNYSYEKLIELCLEEKSRNTESGYKKYRTMYVLHFLKKKDYKRIIWNLYIKSLKVKPFSHVFYNEMPPASYSEIEGVKPSFHEGVLNLKNNINKIKLIPFSNDEKTQKVLFNILYFRLYGDKFCLLNDYDYDNQIYFDDELIKCSDKEVFIDCGGYIGDTTETFIKKYKHYKKIYFIEPDIKNIIKSKKSLIKYNDIEFIPKVIGESKSKALFKSLGDMGSRVCYDNDQNNNVLIDATTLDGEINEDITFIKMDIEGSELSALKGAYNHIKKNSPKLAISLYHKLDDLYNIPLYILSINPRYKLYLRHYGVTFSEVVLYAIAD